MRILHFYKTSYPDTIGGVAQLIHQLAKGTVKEGIKVDVLSLTTQKHSTPIEVDGYTVHQAPLNFQIASTGFSFSAFSYFAKLAKQADIIHYHFPWPFMDVVHFATRVRKPTIVTYHSDIIRQKKLLTLYRPLKRQFLASANHIVATSPNYVATSPVLSRFSDKVSIVPIGLDKTSYPKPTTERLAYWSNRLGKKFYLFVGVLRYYKGLHILLEAARGTDYPIVIIGEGPMEQSLKEQINRLGLTNIQLLGYLPTEDMVAILSLSYGVVFPSHLRSEAFGISLLEGAMYGKPMISSEIGTGTTYINLEDETGLVVPPNDPIALRQAMQYLWNNETEAALMGQCAEERFQTHFTSDQMVNAYMKLYHQFIK